MSGVGVEHRRIVHAILCDHPEGDVLYVHSPDVAKGFGFTTVAKSGNEAVRWARVNEYLSSFVFPHKWGKTVSSRKTWCTGWGSKPAMRWHRSSRPCWQMKCSLLFGVMGLT